MGAGGSEGLSRRDLLAAAGKVAAVGGAALVVPATAAIAQETTGRDRLTVRQGTNIAASVSPDGRWIAMDLYSVIWLLPAAGGVARRVTDDLQDATRPQWSPDSTTLTFQAYRDGNYHVWTVDLHGGPRKRTDGEYDHREPRFSPDGATIAFSSDRGGSYGIWLLDLATGRVTKATDTASDEAEPSWSPDGRRIVFTVDGKAVDTLDLSSGATARLVTEAADTAVFGPALAPDGTTLAHIRQRGADVQLVVDGRVISGKGEDVFAFAPQWLSSTELFHTGQGALLRRTLGAAPVAVPFAATVEYQRRRDRPARRRVDQPGAQPVKGIAGPVLSPDGRAIAFRALGALWLLPIGGKPKAIATGGFNADPDFSRDGTSLVYSSDRTGTPALWRHDLATGTEERLTDLPGAQVTPRWSPDGTKVAYQDQDGATWLLDVASRRVRQVLPALFLPGRPTFSPDGHVLALAAVKPNSRRFREGTSQILTVDTETGETRYAEPAPFRSLSTRGDDGPVWSPDGSRLAFVLDSLLWTVEVDGAGRLTGEPRQITDEVTDAPSWSGDSTTLLYLNNGALRLVPATGGTPRTVPHSLVWANAQPPGRTLVRAGAMWDGRADHLRRDVDILLEGNRVVSVRRRTDDRVDARIIDATHLTAMPGLIDAHNHWHLRGRQWGDRQGRLWLAYGITTTRSPGDPAYRMLETREAIAAARQVGPRFFATGEAIDGTRVYYNMMRPTRDTTVLRRELDRATALDYDLIKTYVRLPASLQKDAIHKAHRAGRYLTSHYLYPAAALGMDGMEHTGATNRLGYSHTSSRTGKSYEDAVRLFAHSGMSITPTLFSSMALYAQDRSLVEDERTKRLYPPWEYEQLLTKAASVVNPSPPTLTRIAALPNNVDMVLRIHRAGGLVIAGTDAPIDNIAVSLHMNLRAMVHHGFTPHEALTTATHNPARLLGLPHLIGAITPGHLADITLIHGDPLTDIKAAAAVEAVIANGVHHTIPDLMRTIPTEPIPAPPAPADHSHPTPFWWHGESERTTHVCCST